MNKSGIDENALIKMFSEASAKQGEALRKSVSEATLKALQGRELSLANIRKVVKTVTQAASTGIAQNPATGVDLEALLSRALAGMDSALLQAVEANRRALEQFVERGADLRDKQLKEAVSNIEKMEDVFFAAVTKASQASGPLQATWEQALGALKVKGTDTGNQATVAVEQLMSQAQTALREGRASSMRAAQAMLDSYTALVSGVLIGMSEGLQQRSAAGAGGEAGSDEGGSAAAKTRKR